MRPCAMLGLYAATFFARCLGTDTVDHVDEGIADALNLESLLASLRGDMVNAVQAASHPVENEQIENTATENWEEIPDTTVPTVEQQEGEGAVHIHGLHPGFAEGVNGDDGNDDEKDSSEYAMNEPDDGSATSQRASTGVSDALASQSQLVNRLQGQTDMVLKQQEEILRNVRRIDGFLLGQEGDPPTSSANALSGQMQSTAAALVRQARLAVTSSENP